MASPRLDITASDEKKIFVQYMVPSMISMIAVAGYSFVDTFVVGRAIGAQAVAAMGLGTPVLCILYALGFLFGAGGGVRYSIFRETGQKDKAVNAYTVSMSCAFLLGIAFCVFGNLFMHPLVRFLGASDDNIGLTVSYLRWIVSLAIFMITDIVLGCYMRNEGHPNVAMIATITGTGLNIILDFVFVMGFKWGMAGASFATCLASIISVGINLTYSIAGKTALHFRYKGIDLKEIFYLIQTGVGSFIVEGATAAIPLCFNNAAKRAYGDAGVSAFTVIVTINLVIYALISGVSQGMQPMISANYGAGKPKRIKKFLCYSLSFSVVLGAVFLAAAEIWPGWMCSLFVDAKEEAYELAVSGLRLHSPSFVFMAVSIVIGIYFQAEERALPSFAILLGRSLLFPIMLVFVLGAFMSGTNIWIAVPLGEAAAFLLSIVLKLIDSRKMSKV